MTFNWLLLSMQPIIKFFRVAVELFGSSFQCQFVFYLAPLQLLEIHCNKVSFVASSNKVSTFLENKLENLYMSFSFDVFSCKVRARFRSFQIFAVATLKPELIIE